MSLIVNVVGKMDVFFGPGSVIGGITYNPDTKLDVTMVPNMNLAPILFILSNVAWPVLNDKYGWNARVNAKEVNIALRWRMNEMM